MRANSVAKLFSWGENAVAEYHPPEYTQSTLFGVPGEVLKVTPAFSDE
jgi:hypothetical protein